MQLALVHIYFAMVMSLVQSSMFNWSATFQSEAGGGDDGGAGGGGGGGLIDVDDLRLDAKFQVSKNGF